MPVGTEIQHLRFNAFLTDRPIISSALKKTGLPRRLVDSHNGTGVIERLCGTVERRGKAEGGRGKEVLIANIKLQIEQKNRSFVAS
jgi:hypothetical protein